MKSEQENIVFGSRAVIEAIKSGKEINKVLINKTANNDLVQEVRNTALQYKIQIQFVPIEKINKLCRNGNHQGVLAQISPVEYRTIENLVIKVTQENKKAFILLLDGITDVRNFGAIARSAECLGVDGIVIQDKGGVQVTPDAVKTSAGALLRLPVAKVAHIKDAIYYLQASGIQVVACTEKTDRKLSDTDFTLPTAIVMGAEDKGVSSGVMKICDGKSAIPMYGEISSYNVASAATIAMYEVDRQRAQ